MNVIEYTPIYGDKIYLISRGDLKTAYQAVQCCHALREFISEHPEIEKLWFKNSNYLCLLSAKNEHELINLLSQVENLQLKYSIFREPDLNNEITAIALQPHPKVRKLCKSLNCLI